VNTTENGSRDELIGAAVETFDVLHAILCAGESGR
jgi:hypothetical protein